ncbi:MAG: peptide ABC transporter substrate-binding protein [Ktedonobacteraceae bacterium]
MRPKTLFRRGSLPALCSLIMLLLAACGGGTPSPNKEQNQTKAPASQQIYRYGDVATDISTFDPGQATDQPSIEAIQMVFTGLVQLDNNLQVQPQLAQSYDISPDGLAYTFHLRPHLRFSDGTPLTSQDVAYSIDRALSPAVASLNGVTMTYLGQIKGADQRVNGKISTLLGTGIKVLDANTIQLLTSQKTAYFLQALTYPTSFVVEKSVIDKWGLTKWTDHLNDNSGQGGDGPFKVLSYNHTTGITFVPNSNYYDAQPQLQKVEFTFYKTAQSAFQAYQAGQVDFIKAVPPEQVQIARALQYSQYSQNAALTTDYIAMNYLYKPFDNIHIRQAFALAINKDVLAQAIFNNVRTPTCHIVPNGMPGYNPNLQCPDGLTTKGDAAKAKALFQQGLTEEGLTLATFPKIQIAYENNVPVLEKEITTLRQIWQQTLGVNVTSQVLDFVTLLKAESQTTCTQIDLTTCQNKGLQMWAAAWGADYPDPQDWISLQFGKNASNNEWNYGENLSSTANAQQQVQTQMDQADVEQDQTARFALYNRIEQQLVNDVAWIPIDQRDTSHVLKSYVIGQTTNAVDLIPPNEWSSIYIVAH